MLHTSIHKNLPKIIALFRKYKVRQAHLFGSAITDRFNDKSDVDFLVKFDENVAHSEYAANFFGLYNSLKALLNRDIDLVIQKTVKNRYFQEELNETKILLYDQEREKIPA